MAAYTAASTSVPLMNMGSYQTFTKSEGIANRFARVAIPIYDRVVGFRDLLALALVYHLFHIGLAVRDASTGTPADKCAVSSWLMICIFATLMVIIVVSNVWRVLNAFSATAEVLLGLLYVLIAIVIAGGTGPHRWALAQGAQDVCSAAASPAAQSAYWFGPTRTRTPNPNPNPNPIPEQAQRHNWNGKYPAHLAHHHRQALPQGPPGRLAARLHRRGHPVAGARHRRVPCARDLDHMADGRDQL